MKRESKYMIIELPFNNSFNMLAHKFRNIMVEMKMKIFLILKKGLISRDPLYFL